jgi:hypothetical protein
MNSLSPYHSTSTEILLKRFRLWKRQYLHIVIYTSLFWIFVDVFFIMLFSDCTKEVIIPCPSSSSLLINNNSRVFDQNRPLNPKIILGKVKYQNETIKTSAARKWWEVDPGLNIKIDKEIFYFYVIGATNPPNWHGEAGRAVVIPTELKQEAAKRFTENQFNIIASDLMALNRSIKDQRSPR